GKAALPDRQNACQSIAKPVLTELLVHQGHGKIIQTRRIRTRFPPIQVTIDVAECWSSAEYARCHCSPPLCERLSPSSFTYLRYLGIPQMETKSGGRWSIPEAANVIKAIFFVESIGHERLPTLRYSQIRE